MCIRDSNSRGFLAFTAAIVLGPTIPSTVTPVSYTHLDTAMQGHRHHRREGNGHAVHAVLHRQAQSRQLHGVSFRKPSDAPLPDALFLESLPAGTGKKSSSVSHYVSGLTDVVSNFLYKISTSVTCIFESLHYLCSRKHGSSSVGRAPVSKTGCREFEPLLPCNNKPL